MGKFAWFTLALVGCSQPAAIVHEEPVTALPALPAPDCGEPNEDEYVSWHGEMLVVPGALVDPNDGVVSPFNGPSWAPVSPDGTRLASVEYVDGAEVLTVRTLAGAVLYKEPVPLIIKAPDLDQERVSKFRSTEVYWWTDRELLVVQDLLPPEAYIECQMLDVQTKVWSDVVSCPSGGMIDLADIVRGPGGLVSLLSSGEGHPSVDVVAWAPDKGQQDAAVPAFDLYPFGPLHVRFSDDPDVLFFETPCDLRQERGCMQKVGEDDDQSVFLFRWRRDAELELVREGLPPSATYAPNAGVWAWPTTRGIALGDPAGDFRCVMYDWPKDG